MSWSLIQSSGNVQTFFPIFFNIFKNNFQLHIKIFIQDNFHRTIKFPFAAEIGIHVAIYESDAHTIINQLLCRRSSS